MKNFARSLAVHAVIVVLVVLCGAAVHKTVPVHHQSVLILPMDLPVPTVRPVPSGNPRADVSTPHTVARLAIGALRITQPVDEKPAMRPLDLPSAVELPSSTLRVVEAPQAVMTGFGSTPAAGSLSSHQGTVSQAGFGQQTGVIGSGSGRVVAAGFSVATTPAPRAVTTSSAQTPTHPVITYEPAAVYTEQARAAGIQGTVDIRVTFKADGQLEVLGIINGLPGLNDSALAVARGIRFVPGPSDFTTTVHVRFQLA